MHNWRWDQCIVSPQVIYLDTAHEMWSSSCCSFTRALVVPMQVCLAAEKCGNLDFDVRNDMWNSSEGLFCNSSAQQNIAFWDILRKVQ